MSGTRFQAEPASLAGVCVLQRMPIEDERGYLERMYCAEELAGWLGGRRVVQINHTLTRTRGAIRGMHYQLPPHAETKLISCLRGEVFDVAVDVRRGSPTFLQWFACRLSDTNRKTMLIPEGFAHGFQTLSAQCEMLYLHTSAYRRDAEGGLNPLDSRLSIAWPLEIGDMSSRDRQHPPLDDSFEGVAL